MSLTNLIDNKILNGTLSFPLMDVIDTDTEMLVNAELPGFDKKDIEIFIEDNMLTVKGEKKTSIETATYSERKFGSFERTVSLPQNADLNNISAEYKNGILSMKIQKNIEIDDTKVKIEIK